MDPELPSRQIRLPFWSIIYSDPEIATQTALECDFVEHFFPKGVFPDILDLACGSGRHSLELARRGYRTTGVDLNDKALEVARAAAEESHLDARFVELDILRLDRIDGRFDGILIFWQSFGFFSGTVQVGLFSQIIRLLRPGGRLILDVFNALHYRSDGRGQTLLDGPTELLSPWLEIERATTMVGYEDDLLLPRRSLSTFADPNLSAPGEIAGLTANFGLRLITACSEYTPRIAATAEHARMQLVFERE